MNLARRVIKLEKMSGRKARRFLVRYENPETGLLDPPGGEEADYTKIFVVRVVKPVVYDGP